MEPVFGLSMDKSGEGWYQEQVVEYQYLVPVKVETA